MEEPEAANKRKEKLIVISVDTNQQRATATQASSRPGFK